MPGFAHPPKDLFQGIEWIARSGWRAETGECHDSGCGDKQRAQVRGAGGSGLSRRPMRRTPAPTTGDLFGSLPEQNGGMEPLAEGAAILRAFAAKDAPALLAGLQEVAAAAPFRHMTTPGGYRMSL